MTALKTLNQKNKSKKNINGSLVARVVLRAPGFSAQMHGWRVGQFLIVQNKLTDGNSQRNIENNENVLEWEQKYHGTWEYKKKLIFISGKIHTKQR